MRDNMPVLYVNVMDGLPSTFARDCFLWATERSKNDRMCYSAERFAREADALFSRGSMLRRMIQMAGAPDVVNDDLMMFIQKRHANYRLGNNVPQPPTPMKHETTRKAVRDDQ